MKFPEMDEEEGGNLGKGVLYSFLLCIPLWLAIACLIGAVISR